MDYIHQCTVMKVVQFISKSIRMSFSNGGGDGIDGESICILVL